MKFLELRSANVKNRFGQPALLLLHPKVIGAVGTLTASDGTLLGSTIHTVLQPGTFPVTETVEEVRAMLSELDEEGEARGY